MDRRTTATYKAMWEIIFTLVPQLRTNVKRFNLDGELAAANAAVSSFDDVKLQLCLFHGKWVSTMNNI